MGGYLVNFTVYTMAMLGLISFAVFVFKKFTDGTMRSNKSKFLNIEESMSLSPRKTLHVVRAGNEKFLIAADIDRTTLISKLESTQAPQKIENLEKKISKIDILMEKNSRDFGKLQELMKEKEEVEAELEHKYERWEYLNDLAQKIEEQKNNK